MSAADSPRQRIPPNRRKIVVWIEPDCGNSVGSADNVAVGMTVARTVALTLALMVGVGLTVLPAKAIGVGVDVTPVRQEQVGDEGQDVARQTPVRQESPTPQSLFVKQVVLQVRIGPVATMGVGVGVVASAIVVADGEERAPKLPMTVSSCEAVVIGASRAPLKLALVFLLSKSNLSVPV